MKANFKERKLEILSEELEGLADYIKSLWQFLPIAVCNINPRGAILDVNQAFEELSLWSISEISGNFLSTIFSQKEASEIIEQTIKKRFLSKWEANLLTKKGKKIAVAVYSRAREDKEGDIIGFFLAIVDIRESKKFQEKLKRGIDKKTKELQEKIEELEKINRLMVGRELKMIELKEEIKQLKKN